MTTTTLLPLPPTAPFPPRITVTLTLLLLLEPADEALDPDQFVGEVKQAYQIARHDPALLLQLHCWCGCDRTDGHQNLLDCYRDTHGAHCAICTGEAIEAEKLAGQGMPVEKIRDALRDRFANGE